MKKLKKVLSLVLVVAMLASMLIVGAAAAETVETNYPEAVTVMTGIGIIEGDEGGIRPTDTVTREEAAKIIAYIVLGPETAETLKTTVAPFADVAADRWSAGYIAYLKNQGIISGVTDTLFDPTAKVTSIAFAKMMLVALGYGQNDEFEGDAWDINTITYARDNDIFEGTKAADLTLAATREECMLYGFNALTKAATVNYNKTFESYYVGPHALSPIEGEIEHYNEYDKVYPYTLAWKNYELQQITVGTDGFGRPAVSWNADGVDVADTVVNADPTVVLYGSVNSSALAGNLSKAVVDAINKNIDEETTKYAKVTVYVDGETGLTSIASPIKSGHLTNGIAGAGATTEIYVDYVNGQYLVNVVIWYEHIGTVTKVSKTNNEITVNTEELTYNQPSVGEKTQKFNLDVSGEDFDITGYAKKDVVIYTRGIDAAGDAYVASIRAAEPVVGTYVSTGAVGSGYVIDGASVSGNKYLATVNKPDTFGAAYEFYYDSMGALLKAVEYDTAAATGTYQYLYVKEGGVASQYKLDTDPLNTFESKILLNVVYANGGKATVEYDIREYADGSQYIVFDGEKVAIRGQNVDPTNKNGTNAIVDTTGMKLHGGIVDGQWYSYTVTEDGYVNLKTLDKNNFATAATKVAFKEGKNDFGVKGFAANSQTVLTMVNANGVAVSYTGVANFPTWDKDGKTAEIAIVTHGKDSKVAKNIVVYADSTKLVSNVDYAYVLMSLSSDSENVTYWAYRNGGIEYMTVKLDNVLGLPKTDRWGTDLEPAGVSSTIFSIDTTSGETELTYVAAVNDRQYTMDMSTFATLWYENATVDTVDDGFFTTVEVEIEGYTTAFNNFMAANNTLYGQDDDNDFVGDHGINKELKDLQAELEALEKDAASNAQAIAAKKLEVEAKQKEYNAALAEYNATYEIYMDLIADVLNSQALGFTGVIPSQTWYLADDVVIYDCMNGGVIVDELNPGDCFMAIKDVDATGTVIDDTLAYIWIVG